MLLMLSMFCSIPVQSQEQKSPDKSALTPEEMGITFIRKEGVDTQEYGLTMTVKPDKAVYAVGEPIKINITTQNNSGWYFRFRESYSCTNRLEEIKPEYQVLDESGHELPFTKSTKASIDRFLEIERQRKLGKWMLESWFSCDSGTTVGFGTNVRVVEVTSSYVITAPGTYLLKYEENGILIDEPFTVIFGRTRLSASTSIIVK
jgi:hypothetical protein